MSIGGTILGIIIILLVIYVVVSCVRIVPQAQAYVIERLAPIMEPGRLDYILKCRLSTEWREKFC